MKLQCIDILYSFTNTNVSGIYSRSSLPLPAIQVRVKKLHFNYGNLYVEGCQKMAMQTSVFFYFSVNLTSFVCLSCPVLLVLSCLSCLPCSAALSCLSGLPCWACSILPDGSYALFFLSCLPYPACPL